MGGTQGATMKGDRGGKDGWWRLIYEPEYGRFSYPKEEELNFEDGDCFLCKKMEEEKKDGQVEVGGDGNSVRIKNTWYTVGQFIMVEDQTLQFKTPKREPEVYPKEKVDIKVQGDHFSTWDPFQVVRLEQIVQEGQEVFLRVRKLYRPHDTHLTHEEGRTKAYTCLYWTEEIARMHLPEYARRTNKVSMDTVVGVAWVTCQQGGDVDKLVDWTDEGEDRFFISEAYNSELPGSTLKV